MDTLGYTDISSEMFWGGGFHHQLEQSIASSPHELCMEKFYGPKTLKRSVEYPTSSDDLSHEGISGLHPWTNTFKVNVQITWIIASGFWWSVLRSYCMIAIVQDEQLQHHIILRGMVPFGSNMFTTHFRIQPLKPNVLHLWSRSHKLHQDVLKLFWEKHVIVWPHQSASIRMDRVPLPNNPHCTFCARKKQQKPPFSKHLYKKRSESKFHVGFILKSVANHS